METVESLKDRAGALFGACADVEGPMTGSGAVLRLSGIDLGPALSPDQADLLFDALSQFRIICIAGQDLASFSLDHFERFANHWGAPVPHPNNFLRGGKPAQQDGASDGPIELIPYQERRAAAVDRTFPGRLQILPHQSPVVLVVANFAGEPAKGPVVASQGGSWHTDIEYEALPIYVSMFLAQHVPVARRAPGGTWVPPPSGTAPYHADADAELLRRRLQLPRNGETAFADTAGAFAALSAREQEELADMNVRRRLNEDDEGWLAPLVRINPRSGLSSLHSPIWASRPGVRPPVEIEGMSTGQSRALLDRLEAHVLQPQFRYDHQHVPGDVTIWDNYMTLHCSPPLVTNAAAIEDARLLYRISCKGEARRSLPRRDDPEWLAAHVPGGYVTPPQTLQGD